MLTRQMHDVLDLMFLCGLSDPLYSSLKDIADHIPPLLRTIQDRLLETISQALTGQLFRPLGAPVKSKGANMSYSTSESQALALHILGTFDFTGHALNEFVLDAVCPYLEHESAEVRQEAVLAATQLFIHDPICNQTSAHSIEIVNEVLEKLLTVGITDPSEFTLAAQILETWLTFKQYRQYGKRFSNTLARNSIDISPKRKISDVCSLR